MLTRSTPSALAVVGALATLIGIRSKQTSSESIFAGPGWRLGPGHGSGCARRRAIGAEAHGSASSAAAACAGDDPAELATTRSSTLCSPSP